MYLTHTSTHVADVTNLHVISVASMFIASKYENISPLTLDNMYNNICHNKISKNLIKQTELSILHTLDFDLSCPTLATLNALMIEYLHLQDFF